MPGEEVRAKTLELGERKIRAQGFLNGDDVNVFVTHVIDELAASAIIFRGEVGPPLEQIAAIRAREILDGKLAKTRARLLRPPVESAATPAVRAPPVPTGWSVGALAHAQLLSAPKAHLVFWGQAAP